MDKLMFEVPSPNVTKIIPFKLDWLDHLKQDSYSINCHQNGIYEFVLSANKDYMKKQIFHDMNQLFQTHCGHVYDVSVTGLKDTYSGVGSERFCTMNYPLAEALTRAIKGRSAVDVIKDENGQWLEMVNVSQYFRFMRYKKGGEHFPHYDSDFEYEYNKSITKYSLVMYFTDCESGEFAFVNDKGTKFEGIISDWDRQATEEEISIKIKPRALKILVFPHTLCHTVLPYTDTDGERIICRGDILFKKVG